MQKEGGKIGEIVRYPTEALKRFAEEEKSTIIYGVSLLTVEKRACTVVKGLSARSL